MLRSQMRLALMAVEMHELASAAVPPEMQARAQAAAAADAVGGRAGPSRAGTSGDEEYAATMKPLQVAGGRASPSRAGTSGDKELAATMKPLQVDEHHG
eukprot:scaffold304262_cov15-Tisochrysis_lutea.AAC.1